METWQISMYIRRKNWRGWRILWKIWPGPLTGDGQMGQDLSREDGLAALQMASAMVCGDCARCNLYSDSQREDSYYLYYLLRAFEQNGSVGQEDMPRLFQEACRKQADYVGQLNRNLGRATMNLSWKNRFLESRDVVISQFRELAAVLDEFARQLLCATDQTTVWEKMVRRAFARRHMAVEQMLILEYDNKRKEAFLTVRTTNGRCMLSKDAAQILNQVFGNVLLDGRPGTAAISLPGTGPLCGLWRTEVTMWSMEPPEPRKPEKWFPAIIIPSASADRDRWS